MARMGKRHTSESLDVALLVTSLVMGFIGFLVSAVVYSLIKNSMSSSLAVGLSFMIFAIVFILLMVFVNMRNDNLGYHIAKHHDGSQIFIALLVIIILTFGLGVLFEFLYERNFSTDTQGYMEPTSYVFIIDNSGSMETNDPEGLRYSAIKQIVSNKDTNFPYAVYSFSDAVTEERALAPVSAGNNDLQPQNSGGTAIKGALKTLHEEYDNKLKKQLGASPKFLLLSDGYATDIFFKSGLNRVLKKYAKDNITVSTVGLGSPDEELMQQIADATGGVYVSADNVAMLEDAMSQAITEQGEEEQRTLFTRRNAMSLDFLYAVMRILFTSILGILISCAMLFATGKGEDSEKIIVSSVITGVLAGVLLELGINALRIPQILMRCIYFLLVASTFVTQKAFGGSGSGRKYDDMKDSHDVRVSRKQMGKISGVGNGSNNGFDSGFDSGFGSNSNSNSGSSFDDFF